MVLLVEEFMSRTAALQFEWAWQHEDSRHMSKGEPGNTKRRQRPRRSLTANLEKLHSLLQSPCFSRWPLNIRIFASDVYQLWRVWCDRANGTIPEHIRTIPDGNCPHNSPEPETDHPRVGSIDGIQTDYSKIQDYLEKAVFLLDDPNELHCKVCEAQAKPEKELVIVCPQASCFGISHLLCLSARFLKSSNDPNQLVPRSGTCPACSKLVQWPLMMQELSFRTRGGKEVQVILRKKARSDKRKAAAARPAEIDANTASNEPLESTAQAFDRLNENVHQDVLDEDWAEELDCASEDDTNERLKTGSKDQQRVEIVIEDSDEDDLEFL
ncbi:Slx4p interacting protein [Aspergillus terreus]